MTASCACTREGAKKTRSPERALSPIQLAGALPPDVSVAEACRAASQEKPGIYSRFPRVILPARGLTAGRLSESSRPDFSQTFGALAGRRTADGVEGQTGIPAKTVRKWLDGETSPNGAAVLTLALAYGPQIIAACVKGAPGWLDAATRHDMARKLNASIDRDRRALEDLMNS